MLFSSNKNLSLNFLLTTTVAFTGNILAKAQNCFSFRHDDERFSLEAPNARNKNYIIDTVWNNLVERCDVREIALGCAEELENYINIGSGAIGGSWCEVGYSKEAPHGCVEVALKDGCDLGYGTNKDLSVVTGIVVTAGILAVSAAVFIMLREQYLRRQRSAVRVRANDAGAPVVGVPVPGIVIEMGNANPDAEGGPARQVQEDLGNGPEGRPAGARRPRNGRRADRQRRRAGDRQQYQLVVPAAAPEVAPDLSVIVERSENSRQPGAPRRGSFSLSDNSHSMWNRAVQQSEAQAAPAPGAARVANLP
jgi:hypothetical protein